jgi:hypothetical protein
MKKVIAISLTVLILFSGITVNVAMHYCGGSIAARKVSLSGEFASCGMTANEMNKPGINKPHMCSNVMSSYTFNNSFISSNVISCDLVKKVLEPAQIPASFIAMGMPEVTETNINNRPPGLCSPYDVDLQFICILRI